MEQEQDDDREQSALPVFSTDEVDFGSSSLFRENRFIGGDRKD